MTVVGGEVAFAANGKEVSREGQTQLAQGCILTTSVPHTHRAHVALTGATDGTEQSHTQQH